MPPLARYPVGTSQDLIVDHNASADPGAEDDAEDRLVRSTGTQNGLGECTAVGVVGEKNLRSEYTGEIDGKRLAVQAEGIRVLEESGRGNGDAGCPDAYPCWTLQSRGLFELHDHSGDLAEDMVVTLRRLRRETEAMESLLGLCRVENNPLDLRAAKIDTPEKSGGIVVHQFIEKRLGRPLKSNPPRPSTNSY